MQNIAWQWAIDSGSFLVSVPSRETSFHLRVRHTCRGPKRHRYVSWCSRTVRQLVTSMFTKHRPTPVSCSWTVYVNIFTGENGSSNTLDLIPGRTFLPILCIARLWRGVSLERRKWKYQYLYDWNVFNSLRITKRNLLTAWYIPLLRCFRIFVSVLFY